MLVIAVDQKLGSVRRLLETFSLPEIAELMALHLTEPFGDRRFDCQFANLSALIATLASGFGGKSKAIDPNDCMIQFSAVAEVTEEDMRQSAIANTYKTGGLVRNKTNGNAPKGKHRPIKRRDFNGLNRVDYNNIRDAAKRTEVDPREILRCLQRSQKTAGGYRWNFAD